MIHIYRIPQKRSNGYCFSGGNPVVFDNVDWMDDPPDAFSAVEARKYLIEKNYFKAAPDGARFLVLCDVLPEWTFQMVKGAP